MCACGCLIFNEKGQVSLQKRSNDNLWENTLLEKENSISKWKWYFRIRLETTISSNTDTLPQLPGDFFDIKSIIKEYRDNQNVKNYKDFKYDLDSDGIMDKITLKHIINENEESYFSNREYYVID